MSAALAPPAAEPPPAAQRTGARWGDLRARIVSAAAFGPIAAAAVFLGGGVLAAFLAVVAALMAWELWRMVDGFGFSALGPRMSGPLGFAPFSAALVAGVALTAASPPWVGVVVIGAGFGLPLVAYAIDGRAKVGLWMGAGLGAVTAAAVSFMALRAHPQAGLETSLWLIVVVAAADTGAYFAGRLIGGPRLWRALSPNKTWAGLAGALGAGAGASALVLSVVGAPVTVMAFLVGALVAGAGQAGDLAESWLKRRHRAKDASGLIPGHGGVLDRLDSLLAAACATALAAAAGANIWVIE